MSAFSEWPLQQAVFSTLSGDATLQSLVTAVYDYVPQGAVYPFLTIGMAAGKDWSTATTHGVEFTLSVQCYSRAAGRKETESILAQAYALLHRQPLSVSGQTLVLLQFTDSAIRQEADGITYNGTLRFHALVQAN